MLDVEVTVSGTIEKVWNYWNEVNHIQQWYNLDDSWHCAKATNDLVVGGTFSFRLEAKDGSSGFDFGGTYDEIKHHELLSYGMKDGRKEIITFAVVDDKVRVVRSFDPHTLYDAESQKSGWQTVSDHFKKYIESH